MKSKSNLVITIKENQNQNHLKKPSKKTQRYKKQTLYKPRPETMEEYLEKNKINFTIFFN